MGKVTIYGKGKVGDRIESTYYKEGDQTLWSTTVDASESWSGIFETNDPGDFESYYLFRFPGEPPRRVFLPSSSLPLLMFEPVGSVPNFSPQPTGPAVGGAVDDRREIFQANTFTAPCILKNVGGVWDFARADSIANSDIWLCVEATPTSFKKANSFREYYLPNHGIAGADNSLLLLSATSLRGELTTVAPTTGQVLSILGVRIDANYIYWAPSFRVEVVA
jgi:hypothetical protein